MVKITVLKVDIECFKCKKKLIKAVSSLQGIDEIEVDEEKGTLTITGNADPYDVIVKIKKIRKNAKVLSIGPPDIPPPPKQDSPKKPKEKKKPKQKPIEKVEEKNKPEAEAEAVVTQYMVMPPHYYQHAQPVAVLHMTRWDEPDTSCTIM
ncbi:heavy metal-associated isoprenylated plant protein 43-like [Vicia villosa]|uniref:heavy metal-associated isoprenylated plant protein 43-like n=1 Tax=Vicia villosa TaxID=3911 RepID=UPI00273BBE5B|nr:heavy metal-associated isoprenylated plant protein 43-like [Vicia villosa]